MKPLTAVLIAVAVHEASHIAAALVQGLRIRRIGLSWTGVYVVRESGLPFANLITTLAGPFANLALALLWPVAPAFAQINLLLGIVNLLPLPKSDGARAIGLLRQFNFFRATPVRW